MLVRFWFYLNLGGPWRRRLAGGEHCSCDLQMALHFLCERMRATEHAPRDPFYVFEHRHGLAEIVDGQKIIGFYKPSNRRKAL